MLAIGCAANPCLDVFRFFRASSMPTNIESTKTKAKRTINLISINVENIKISQKLPSEPEPSLIDDVEGVVFITSERGKCKMHQWLSELQWSQWWQWFWLKPCKSIEKTFTRTRGITFSLANPSEVGALSGLFLLASPFTSFSVRTALQLPWSSV